MFALGASLGADGLTIVYTAGRLNVADEGRPGAEDTITCRPRPDDGDRLWFWTGDGEPLAETGHLPDAILHLRHHLNRRADQRTDR